MNRNTRNKFFGYMFVIAMSCKLLCFTRNFLLQLNTVYQVKIEAINRAGLITSAETSPILFDNSMPTAGHVSEGSDFTEDLVWWGFTDHMKGMYNLRICM
jgi:hypothetical protein